MWTVIEFLIETGNWRQWHSLNHLHWYIIITAILSHPSSSLIPLNIELIWQRVPSKGAKRRVTFSALTFTLWRCSVWQRGESLKPVWWRLPLDYQQWSRFFLTSCVAISSSVLSITVHINTPYVLFEKWILLNDVDAQMDGQTDMDYIKNKSNSKYKRSKNNIIKRHEWKKLQSHSKDLQQPCLYILVQLVR